MMIPTVHLNGTGGKELRKQVTDAGHAVFHLLVCLDDMAPNGRDYYIQGPDALKRAVAEHRARVEKVVELRDELLVMVEAIADQMDD